MRTYKSHNLMKNITILNSQPPQPQDNKRWWEFYVIRYFIGSIIGAIIVAYILANSVDLQTQLHLNQMFDAKQITGKSYVLFLLIGFAYCYIASAPILVMHATRGIWKKNLDNKTEDKSKCKKIINCVVALIVIAALIITGCFTPKFMTFIKQCYHTISCVLLALIVCVQIWLLTFSFKQTASYYKNLTRARAVEKKSNRDNYIESYKHLREHGNAFAIILFELLLAFILINTSSINCIIIVITLWIIPAAVVWALGTYLEFKMI